MTRIFCGQMFVTTAFVKHIRYVYPRVLSRRITGTPQERFILHWRMSRRIEQIQYMNGKISTGRIL